jgi:hypothetical protein
VTVRRALVALVVIASLVGMGVVGARRSVASTTTFTQLGTPTMPFVPPGPFITSSWFCPGVPNGRTGLGGRVEVTNPSDAALAGRITVFTDLADAAAVSHPLSLAARTSQAIDLSSLQPLGNVLSAVVEIDGGGGFVEQQAVDPAGASVAPCANATSSTWYFADGFTAADSTEQLVLTNPSPDAAIVDIGFVTSTGVRNPSRLQGYPVPGHSVQLVELGARDEPVLAAKVVASRGRVVAGRLQHYVGGGRTGYSMTLGAPSLSDQYYFADGDNSTAVDESYRIFNPTDQDVTVDLVFLGVPPDATFANDQAIDVPAGGVVSVATKDIAGLPAGRHGAVLSTLSRPAIVAERVITRTTGGSSGGSWTTVVLGAPGALASPTWSAAIGTDTAASDAIVVLNADNVDTTVSVSTVGPGGLVAVPGLEAVALPAGGVVAIPLDQQGVLGKPVVVHSAQRLFVERLLPRGQGLPGRSGSFALAVLT